MIASYMMYFFDDVNIFLLRQKLTSIPYLSGINLIQNLKTLVLHKN